MNLGKRQPSTGRVGVRIIMLDPDGTCHHWVAATIQTRRQECSPFAFGTGDHSGLPVGRSITSRPGRP